MNAYCHKDELRECERWNRDRKSRREAGRQRTRARTRTFLEGRPCRDYEVTRGRKCVRPDRGRWPDGRIGAGIEMVQGSKYHTEIGQVGQWQRQQSRRVL